LKLSIHHKITLILTLTVAIILSGAYVYLNKNLRDYTYQRIKSNLAEETDLAKLYLEQISREDFDIKAMDTHADQIGERLDLRATVIALDGRVLGDSELNGKDLQTVENHLFRPEIQQALGSGLGESRRFSTTIQKDMLYMARTFGKGPVRGFIRLAIP
jgi:two-component system phosphate regulon sensor histidine kinase PhoR